MELRGYRMGKLERLMEAAYGYLEALEAADGDVRAPEVRRAKDRLRKAGTP